MQQLAEERRDVLSGLREVLAEAEFGCALDELNELLKVAGERDLRAKPLAASQHARGGSAVAEQAIDQRDAFGILQVEKERNRISLGWVE